MVTAMMSKKNSAQYEEGVAKEQTQNEEPDRAAVELRESVNSSLINVGVLAALMMALSGAIYTDPAPPPGECYGEPMLRTEMVIVWMSMGFYFFSINGALVLHMDVEGIPNSMLMQHLASGAGTIYCLPHMATALGIFMTAMAYGIDIGERGGCGFFIFGVIAAPGFVMSIVALWFYCRRRRQKLFATQEYRNKPVISLFATWADRFHGVSA